MSREFHFLPRGSYSVPFPPEEAAKRVAEYCTTKEQQGLKRRLDLNFERDAHAVETLRLSNGRVEEAYAVETQFIDKKREDASESLGHTTTLQAVVIGYKESIGDSEVIPFNLKVKDEDLVP